MMILGRVGAGLGAGIIIMVVPLFNADIAPKQLRGRLVSLQQLSIAFGIMVIDANYSLFYFIFQSNLLTRGYRFVNRSVFWLM